MEHCGMFWKAMEGKECSRTFVVRKVYSKLTPRIKEISVPLYPFDHKSLFIPLSLEAHPLPQPPFLPLPLFLPSTLSPLTYPP
jgi:hypothetical protein